METINAGAHGEILAENWPLEEEKLLVAAARTGNAAAGQPADIFSAWRGGALFNAWT